MQAHKAKLLPPSLHTASAIRSSWHLLCALLFYIYMMGGCVNQVIVEAGYAKAFDKYECDQLPLLIQLNNEARREYRGNYQSVDII